MTNGLDLEVPNQGVQYTSECSSKVGKTGVQGQNIAIDISYMWDSRVLGEGYLISEY